MRYGIARTTDPTAEPVSVEEARDQLRLEHQLDDELLAGLIRAAREWCEEFTRRAFVSQTWTLTLPRWPTRICLPWPPLVSVTSITYTDEDGASQTLASSQYRVLSDRLPAEIVPAYDVTWPNLRTLDDAISVVYSAGYGGADSVPRPIRQAILLLVAQLYEFREPVIAGTIVSKVPMAVEALLGPFRVPSA